MSDSQKLFRRKEIAKAYDMSPQKLDKLVQQIPGLVYSRGENGTGVYLSLESSAKVLAYREVRLSRAGKRPVLSFKGLQTPVQVDLRARSRKLRSEGEELKLSTRQNRGVRETVAAPKRPKDGEKDE
ncbi:MAG: hypothetical protein AAFP13_04505 [Pseudomonadota bacterium]